LKRREKKKVSKAEKLKQKCKAQLQQQGKEKQGNFNLCCRKTTASNSTAIMFLPKQSLVIV